MLQTRAIQVLGESGLRRVTGSSRNRRSLAKTAYAPASARSPEFEKWIRKKIKRPRQKVAGSLVKHENGVIPTANGGTRPLGIPTVTDRICSGGRPSEVKVLRATRHFRPKWPASVSSAPPDNDLQGRALSSPRPDTERDRRRDARRAKTNGWSVSACRDQA